MRLFFLLLLAFSAAPLLADPIISEFMASNQHSIVDEDGDHSDWIEILNPDSTAVNMAGWALTDKSTLLQEWIFPAVSIPAHSQILVFASGKDRKVVGANLHTNFSLSTNGEYLALVKPNGTTKTTEFAPTFPPQVVDVSYGTSSDTADVVVLNQATAVRAFVPSDNSLGTTWHAANFIDTTWTAGTFGVGYFDGANPDLSSQLGTTLAAMDRTGRNSYIRAHFNVANANNVTAMTLLMNYDDGFYVWINNQYVANSSNAPLEPALTYNSVAGNHGPGTFETFPVTNKINTLVTGDNVIAIQGLNTSTSSSDAFILPQLTITTTVPGSSQIGYFTTATPGAVNGGASSLYLPIDVAFSKASGTFTAPFSLTLSGAGAGQEIHYEIADPTTSPGAAVVDPTINSLLYNGPITIPTSKVIRAAVFETASGRKGRTTSAEYLLLEITAGTNNTSNFTSNLPIIVMDDHGAGVPVDSSTNTYTTGFVHVFAPVNGTASLNATPSVFTRAGMRIRGSSSQSFAKKSFGVEFWDEKNADRDLATLGLSADSDWILNGPYTYDDSYIHNAFIYEVSRRIGRWAPRTKSVEVFLNTNGGKLDYADYNGIYQFTEKIKSGGQRLDIVGIKPEDITGDAVTGGYIFKNDRVDGGEATVVTTTGIPSSDALVVVEPDADFDNTQQLGYLQSYIQTFDTTLLNEKNAGFTTRNYLNYMDRAAWVDHHLLNALAYNVDALRLSAFFYKDRSHKICAGPIWDFDRSLHSDDGRDATPNSWANIEYFFTRDWFGRLFQDPDFVMAWVDRWQQLRQNQLSTANLQALLDQQGAEIGNVAGARDAAKWGAANASIGGVYLNEIADIKTWLATRLAFIDGQMPAQPTANLASGVVSSGTAITLTGAGTLRYTKDGTDPRPIGGGTTSPALAYPATPISITQTTVITARRQLPATTLVFTNPSTGLSVGAIGTNWSGVITRVYLVNEFFAVATDIAVSEINYHPLDPTPAETAALPGVSADDFEFVELRNVGARKVNLFEVKFADTQPFKELVLAPFTLNPGEVAFVVKNKAAFVLRYGSTQSGRIVGEWGEGSIDNGGEHVVITARDGTPIQDFTFADSGDWPGRADGKGSTLEYAGATFTNTDFNNPLNWRSSSEFQGSPGTVGAGPDTRLAINEILTNTSLPYLDAVELKNLTGSPVNIGGWYLSNLANPENADSFKQYAIPAGTTIGASGYAVFDQTQFNPNGAWNPAHGTPSATEFEFDGIRDSDAWLIEADGTGKLIRFVDHVSVGPARLNEAWGRSPDGAGAFYPMLARTCVDEGSAASPRPRLGAPNSAQRSGPVIISEVHHSPSGGNTDLEFVELRNPTASAQALLNWHLRGDVDFDFTSEVIPAGGLLVVLPFAATDSTKLNTFRSAYQMSASLPVVGPWGSNDHLGLPGTVTLYRAETPPVTDPGYTPNTQEDRVDYASGGAWPVTTTGLSLNRRGDALSGGIAGNWKADAPSPGTYGLTYAQWQLRYFPGGGVGSAPEDDPDHDGASNALEYSRGTSPTLYENQFALAPTLVRTTGMGAAYFFTFTRPVDRPGATYTILQSTDMVGWTPASAALISTTPDTSTWQVSVAIDGQQPPAMFFKLQIVAP